MAYLLDEINYMAKTDPVGFVRDCDIKYEEKVRRATDMIIENMKKSPIVLLSGPSGSGKTTTSKKIEEALRERGVMTHALSMDSYFRTVDENSPRTDAGELDLESPRCLDMDLLSQHFDDLQNGRDINVPKYNFAKQKREGKPSATIHLDSNTIVVVEGIHALNDELTSAHPEAMKLYISARSNVVNAGDEVVFKGTWMRLVRRVVRDKLFRGASPEYTFGLWENIRRGEKTNISPFKEKADLKFDSSFPCEVGIMKTVAEQFFRNIPEGVPRYQELLSIAPAFELFEPIDPKLLSPECLLREFLGGGKYKY